MGYILLAQVIFWLYIGYLIVNNWNEFKKHFMQPKYEKGKKN